MPTYAIYTPVSGKVVDIDRVIECAPEHIHIQLGQGEAYLQCNAQPHHKIDVDAGTLVQIPDEAFPEDERPEYMKVRSVLYPPVVDQLDMLWHGMNSGLLPIVPNFYNAIKAVKNAVPKEGEIAPVVIYPVEAIPDDEADE